MQNLVKVLLSDKKKNPYPLRQIKKLPRGSIFIARNLSCKDFYLRKICKMRGIKFFVCGNKQDVFKFDADGIHFKEKDKFKGLGNIRRRFFISSACHSKTSAIKAQNKFKDFILFSPLFKTTSHKKSKNMGRVRFLKNVKNLFIPVFALGGIKKKNISQLKNLGVIGFGGIDYFKDPMNPKC
jgi:thiamine monophosphate synthase